MHWYFYGPNGGLKNKAFKDNTPIGGIVPDTSSSVSPPDGYLFCNGQAVSRSTYAALFAIVSTTYGVGNGSTTFNLPNLVGTFPIVAGGIIPANSSGGQTTHSHTVPSHTHPVPQHLHGMPADYFGHVHSQSHSHIEPSHAHGAAGISEPAAVVPGSGSLLATGSPTKAANITHAHYMGGASGAYGPVGGVASSVNTGGMSGGSSATNYVGTTSGGSGALNTDTQSHVPLHVQQNFMIKFN